MLSIRIIFILLVFFPFLSAQISTNNIVAKIAHQEAIFKLGEKIKKLNLYSNITIEQFLKKQNKYEKFVHTYIEYVQEIDMFIDIPKNMCKITVSISLEDIIVSLKKLEHMPNLDGNIIHNNSQKKLYATSSASLKHLLSDNNKKAQQFAFHMAQKDACQKLIQVIGNINISNSEKINDFLIENNEIRNDFIIFIHNMLRVKNILKYEDTGIVEVIIEIHVRKIKQGLIQVCKTRYKGKNWNPNSFSRLGLFAKSNKIVAKGRGSILKEKYSIEITYIPQWANKNLLVVGESFLPKRLNNNTSNIKKIATERAIADGYDKLIRSIMKLPLQNSVLLKNLIQQNQMIHNKVSATVKKAKIISIIEKNGIVYVTFELYLAQIWRIILHIYS